MTDKIKQLEEALDNCFRETEDDEIVCEAAAAHLHYLKEIEPLLKQMVEAREKATDGEWEYIFGPDFSTDPKNISFVQVENSLGTKGVICRINNSVSRLALTEEDRENGNFICTAANGMNKLREVM